jgi:hypothetical protein
MFTYPMDLKSVSRRSFIRKWGLILSWSFLLVGPSADNDKDEDSPPPPALGEKAKKALEAKSHKHHLKCFIPFIK